MQSSFSEPNTYHFSSTISSPSLALTPKDGLFIATEFHLASLPNEDGDTALHLAVIKEDTAECGRLLHLFAFSEKSIDIYNNLMQTPLHIAIISNQAVIVELLLMHRANPCTPDRYGSTSIHLCAKFNCTECLLKILELYRNRKLDLNLRDYEGLTPLHVAVKHGSVPTFKVLVANGADIDAKDNKGGRTPLIYAIEMNQKIIVEMLLECDASVSQQTYSGDTALHIASGRGLQDIVRLLLRRGADATMKNTHCETPISLATSPLVTDILRSPYKSSDSPDLKHTLTTADTQYASHVARNMNLPMPPQMLRMGGHPIGSADVILRTTSNVTMNHDSPPLVGLHKRGRKIKTEYKEAESDDELPAKRYAASNSLAKKNHELRVTSGSIPIVVSVPPMPTNKSNVKMTHDSNANSSSYSGGCEENKNPDEEGVKLKDQVTLDQTLDTGDIVEVSAEEIVSSKTDDNSSNLEGSASDHHQTDEEELLTVERTEEWKSSEEMYKSTVIFHGSKDQEKSPSRAVIVQRQPEITMATALSKEYRTNYSMTPNYKNFTPSISPLSMSSQILMKSKSVPNSPQPSEENLYQLAREGLAVAAMANYSNTHPVLYKDFSVSNYLKARPSRQAKIKSGTEELQNLALQGLAVAAMNAQSNPFHEKIDTNNLEDHDSKSNLTTVPKHLSKVLNPVSGASNQHPPSLYRSNSLPPKYLYEEQGHSEVPSTAERSAPNDFSSSNALLALAHANARKENVGQAVSAISMAKSHVSNTMRKNYSIPSTSSSDVSENTKLNLRQAIMVKNTASQQPSQKVPNLKIYSPDSKGLKVYDPSLHEFKIYNPFSKDNKQSIRMIVPTVKSSSSSAVTQSTSSKLTVDGLKSIPSAALPPPSTSTELPTESVLQSSTTSDFGSIAHSSSSATEMKPCISRSPILVSKVLNIRLPTKTSAISSHTDSNLKSMTTTIYPPGLTTSYHQPTTAQSVSENSLSQGTPNQKLEVKVVKDYTPTNTVAPIQMINKRTVFSAHGNDSNNSSSISLNYVQSTPYMPPQSDQIEMLSSRVIVSARGESSPTITSMEDECNRANTITSTRSTALSSANTNTTASSGTMVVDSLQQSKSLISVQQITSMPQMALGVPPPVVINPPLQGLTSHSTAPYLQHQIMYVTPGKEYIPVLMPIGQPRRIPIPQYTFPVPKPVIEAQTSGNESVTKATTTAPTQAFNTSFSNAYIGNIPANVPINQNVLCQIPSQDMLLTATRQGGLYPLPSQMYPSAVQQQLDFLHHQQLLRNSLLIQQQNNLIEANKSIAVNAAQISESASSAVTQPVISTVLSPKLKNVPKIFDEQPLNLSKKSGEQPLNLMKTRATTTNPSLLTQSEAETQRGSVIKVASSWQTQPTVTAPIPTAWPVDSALIPQIRYQQETVQIPTMIQGREQVHPSMMLPPPVLISSAVQQTVPPVSVSSLSLPPIHYVNGMPFILRYPQV